MSIHQINGCKLRYLHKKIRIRIIPYLYFTAFDFFRFNSWRDAQVALFVIVSIYSTLLFFLSSTFWSGLECWHVQVPHCTHGCFWLASWFEASGEMNSNNLQQQVSAECCNKYLQNDWYQSYQLSIGLKMLPILLSSLTWCFSFKLVDVSLVRRTFHCIIRMS